MKFKPGGKSGGVLVELSPKDTQLPMSEEGLGSLREFHLKKILVPMDFSECAKKALRYAIPFAKQFDAEITMLHVIHFPVEAPELMVSYAQNTDAARKELQSLADELKGVVTSRAILAQGTPAIEIVDTAVRLGADLIILSTHGRSGLAHVLLGSTAEKVVRYAPCPVLVVRESEREFVEDEFTV